MIQNFIAGIIIQVRRPFRVGDQVTTMEFHGTVRDVDLRAVRLTTFDGLDVVLLARDVLGSAIVNHTRTPLRRTTLEVGVRCDNDLPLARRVLLEALGGVDGVEAEPGPVAWVREFGDSVVNLDAMSWHRSDVATLCRVRSEAAVAIKAGSDRAGIEIPFPQRVLHCGEGERAGLLRVAHRTGGSRRVAPARPGRDGSAAGPGWRRTTLVEGPARRRSVSAGTRWGPRAHRCFLWGSKPEGPGVRSMGVWPVAPVGFAGSWLLPLGEQP